MKIQNINSDPDFVGIQVGQNTIVLPTSDLQDALNYSAGITMVTSLLGCLAHLLISMIHSVKEASFLFEDLSTSLLDK